MFKHKRSIWCYWNYVKWDEEEEENGYEIVYLAGGGQKWEHITSSDKRGNND